MRKAPRTGSGSSSTCWFHHSLDRTMPGCVSLQGRRPDVDLGLRTGGRAPGKKALFGVAVEADDAGLLGRCRMGLLHDLSADSLVRFVTRHVESGSLVVTDAWKGYLPSPWRASPMSGGASPRRARRARSWTRCCRACIGSCRCSSAGCRERTRARSGVSTSGRTWMSSCSASTDADREAGGCCSTASWSWQFDMSRSVAATSSPIHDREALPQRQQLHVVV